MHNFLPMPLFQARLGTAPRNDGHTDWHGHGRHFILSALRAAVLFGTAAACTHQGGPSSPGNPASATVAGTVSYRERIALPPDAILKVDLLKETPNDTGPTAITIVATTSVASAGRQVPLPFMLHYDPRMMRTNPTLFVRAMIRSGEQLLFESSRMNAVISPSKNERLDLVLARFDPLAYLPADLAGTHWVLQSMNGVAVLEGTHPTLDFLKGKATGNGACNTFSAAVDISGSSIRFGAVEAARTSCGTAVSLQEINYLEALEAADGFTVEPPDRAHPIGVTLLIQSGRSDRVLQFASYTRIQH